jgi:HD-GYP domain-containing protein (c-di-GMP phosphodiesterase class II)
VERHPVGVMQLFCAVVALLVGPTVLWPTAGIGSRLLPGEAVGLKMIAAASGLVLFSAGEVHRRRWQLNRDSVELALLVACWLSVESLISLQLGRLWRLSWWDYHVLLLIGFAGSVYAIVAQYRRSRTVEGAMTGILLTNTLEHIQHGYPEALRSLATAVEAKDAHTRGHSARVAELSVRIGEHMGLRPDVLRALAQGGLLHDIGKIGVPDQILNKPGVLTVEERAEIERHPDVGWDIIRQAPSLRRALAVVRHHHERVDGTGYPDRLAGDDIPLEARIAAVADVWDALTSDRAYRGAWPADRALEMMMAGRGTHFDPRALTALLEVLAFDGIAPIHSALGADDRVLDEACHPADGAPGLRSTVGAAALRAIRFRG